MRTTYLYISAWNGSKSMSKPNRKEVESWRRTKIYWCNPIGNVQTCRHRPISWNGLNGTNSLNGAMTHCVYVRSLLVVYLFWITCFDVIIIIKQWDSDYAKRGWMNPDMPSHDNNKQSQWKRFFFAHLFLISSIEKRLQNGTKLKHNAKKKNINSNHNVHMCVMLIC